MEYTKVTCTLTPDTELAREILMAELGEAGFESFVETETGVESYIPSAFFTPEILLADNLQQNEYFTFYHSVEVIADQNWNEVWEQNYFEPLLIEDQCMVRAPFHDTYPEARFQIIINPRMAFGTGNHETTHLMIKAMLELDFKKKNVLDMGCGSGILSILASMKGAAEIIAIDIDEWSVNNTIENAELNQIGNILVRLGDASFLTERQFDIVLANIQRNILLEDMPAYQKVLNPNGILVMSGFYFADLDKINEKAGTLGLFYTGSFERSDWCVANFRA